MKIKFVGLLLTCLLAGKFSIAQDRSQKEVARAVETLEKAMEDGDSTALRNISSAGLLYGHSGGQLEDQEAFIASFVNGSSDFVSIDLSDQVIKVYGDAAVVRHMLNAVTNNNNIPGTVKIAVLTFWHKEKGKWKLVARQAVKPL